jgi:thiamine-phosphate pyrophosphorylase
MLGAVYAITDPLLLPGETLFAAVEEALDAGVTTLQWRDKICAPQARAATAKRLLAICGDYQARLIINDNLELAAEIGAHGVHLGRGDGSIRAARARLGQDAIIGVTCHDNLAWAIEAAEAGASYVAFGRFYSSTTKPNASAANVELLHQAKQQIALPIVAIGGITRHNAAPLFRAGATTVAVCAGIFESDNIGRAVHEITALAEAYRDV